MISNINDKRRHYLLIDEIGSHKSNKTAITKDSMYIKSNDGNNVKKRTTCEWELLVRWKYGSSTWIKLKDLEAAYPVEISEYSKLNKIDDQPAFAWWVKNVFHIKSQLISKVKTKYWWTSHKYGIELPHSIEEAKKINGKNGNNLCRDVIEKEMKKIILIRTYEKLMM